MNLPLAVAVVCLALLGTAKAELGKKLEVSRKQKPHLVEKESKQYGRTFLVRVDEENQKGGISFIDYFLDGELVQIDAVFYTDPEFIPNRMFDSKYAQKHWELVFGEEKVETKKDFKNSTRWSGQNGSVLDFGTGEVNGRNIEFITVSSAKMSLIKDKYYQNELSKIPVTKAKADDDDGFRITFGGNKNKQYRPPQFYKVAPGGAVYDGNSGRYLGHTIGENGND